MPTRKGAERTYRVAIVADLHCGSRYGLVPDSYRPVKAGPSGAFSAYMMQCWRHFVAALPPLDCVIVAGDAMEGEHPTLKSAPDAIDTSPLKQVDMAVEIMAPLRAKTKKLWLVRGTGFHEGRWSEALEALGQELKAEVWSDRRYSGEVLDGEIGGLRFNVAHAQSHGAIYPGTLQNRTVWFATMAERLGKTVESDVIVRAHTHATGKGQYFGKWILSCRAWKLCNPYAIARMEYFRAQALLDLGGHLLTIGPDGIMWKDYAYDPYKQAELRKLA